MPLGSFGNVPDRNASSEELADAFSRLLKEVTYLLNGGLDTLNVNELNADVINAGTLNAALVTVKAALVGLAYIQLSAAGIKINDGTKDTFVADTSGKVTMTGGKVQAKDGAYPNVEFDGVGNIFQASKSTTEYVAINPSYTGSPTFIMESPSAKGILSPVETAGTVALNSTVGKMQVSSQGDELLLNAFSNMRLSCSSLKINGLTGYAGTVTFVKDVVAGVPTYGTMTYEKGILTSVS